MARDSKNIAENSARWALYSAIIYVCGEWLFFATKPSFMSGLSDGRRLLLLTTISAPYLLLLLAGLVILGISRYFPATRAHSQALCSNYFLLFASYFLTVTAFLFFDDYTYTVFGFASSTISGYWRLAYAIVVTICFILIFRGLRRRLQTEQLHPIKASRLAVFILLPILICCVALSFQPRPPTFDIARKDPALPLPDIFFIGIDGVTPDHLSALEYDRDTTPHLKTFARESLIAKNAYSTSDKTVATLISMLTSKYPTETKVVQYPDILENEASHEHLPGMLRQLGYATTMIGVRKFIDAYDLNLRSGFDQSNDRHAIKMLAPRWQSTLEYYFLTESLERSLLRIGFIFGMLPSESLNALRPLSFPLKDHDSKEISQAIEFVSANKQPVFVHLHLLGTHGPLFLPNQKTFSGELHQSQQNMTEFYDDSIADADAEIERLFQFLRDRGRFEKSLIVIYSDHDLMRQLNVRIPLLIRFPGGERRGEVTQNTSLIDVAPTVLDYLGIRQPHWMKGVSLLASQIDPNRYIFSAAQPEGWAVRKRPPYFGFSKIGMVVCDQCFILDFERGNLESIAGDRLSSECPEGSKISNAKALEVIRGHMSMNTLDFRNLSQSSSSIQTSDIMPAP